MVVYFYCILLELIDHSLFLLVAGIVSDANVNIIKSKYCFKSKFIIILPTRHMYDTS